MKTLILILFSVSLIACSKNEIKMNDPPFLEGGWKFKSKSFEGEFTINQNTVVKGSFNILDKSYVISTSFLITEDYIALVGTGQNQLVLLKPVLDYDNNQILVSAVEYDTDTSPTKVVQEFIVITRQ